ncbi:hypothetical protein SI65_10125 [Aspergillus cristatus]|uniref:nitrilase n=1 Tax=Aspergillus cristatus TaxID=573508 RepID=A0A1E3B0N9_ASPCR|nr:hypothetical protein SI65_10125 [Aspergillus cristatus]
MRFSIILGLVGSCAASVLHTNQTANYDNLTIAVVRAPPANWPLPLMTNNNWTGVEFDLNATVSKGVSLIQQAADNGANLVVFPDYPKGMSDNVSIASHIENYVQNSLTLNSPQWNRLVSAAKTNGVYIVPGFSHREGNYIYMAQALISPEGETLHLRHKLRPSGGERTIWSDGTLNELKVTETPYGRLGILECWEHFHPSMTFNVQAQAETLHIASFPYTPDYGDPDAEDWQSAEVNIAAARTYAVNTQAPLAFASVGNVRFITSGGLDINVVDASESFENTPLAYASFNTTGLVNTVPYTTNGEESWGILQQINAGFPSYIPKVMGDFVTRHMVKISDLLQAK